MSVAGDNMSTVKPVAEACYDNNLVNHRIKEESRTI